MAKLGLIFLVFFVVVQVALAASRYPRDTAVAEPADFDPAKSVSQMFDQVKKSVDSVMTKENVDRVMGSLSQVGDQLKKFGQDLTSKINKKD